MIKDIFTTLVYEPIYNALVFFVDIMPNHDIGIAVIIVTILVRIILYPLAMKAIRSQMAMKALAPDIEEIKKKFKDKPEEQGRAMLALYREKGVNPFSGILNVLMQLPILLGLFFVFAKGGFPNVDPLVLYSFVQMPEAVNMSFLGLINMGEKSVILAALVAITQFIYTRLSMGPRGTVTPTEASFSEEMARSFDVQARYVLPLIVGIGSYFLVAAAPLYWLTGNLFMIMQEFIAGRRFHGKN